MMFCFLPVFNLVLHSARGFSHGDKLLVVLHIVNGLGAVGIIALGGARVVGGGEGEEIGETHRHFLWPTARACEWGGCPSVIVVGCCSGGGNG